MNNSPHSIDICAGITLFVVSDSMSVATTRRIAAAMGILDAFTDNVIIELVPSYGSILVIYDENITTETTLQHRLHQAWEQAGETTLDEPIQNVIIDVVYGDIFGEDLANVSANTGIPVDDVITLHVNTEYTVGAVGFAPGFTFLIGLPPELTTPRRATPRLKVPAGSVGIGGAQTGVYALPSAGGWNLIGRTTANLFDAAADPPVKLKLGDTVRFRPVDADSFVEPVDLVSQPAGNGSIEIITPGMQSTIQDLGRYGHARFGFATDGAADRASLVRANRLVGNEDAAAALEITQSGPHLRFHRRVMCAFVGADLGASLNGRPIPPGRRFETMPGDELVCLRSAESRGARAYLAVKGGFDVPTVLDSASTNLTAGIGGWHGRALLKGDRLEVGQQQVTRRLIAPGLHLEQSSMDISAPFRVVPGPQHHRFSSAAWTDFLQTTYHVSSDANRVALRLDGPRIHPIDAADTLSEGIATGSIQITGEGQPIVMLPAHATIGGYTKIATVIPEDWDRLGQLSPGDSMTFVLASES